LFQKNRNGFGDIAIKNIGPFIRTLLKNHIRDALNKCMCKSGLHLISSYLINKCFFYRYSIMENKISLIDYLKTYTAIPIKFINEYYEFYKKCYIKIRGIPIL